MMKNLRPIFLSLLVAGILCSFTQIGIVSSEDTPGTIQAIGNAGSDQVFTFTKWNFTKAQLPEENMENIQLEIEINTSSLSCDWKDLEKNIKKKKDYFYVKKFPTASIAIDGATKNEDGTYTTEAMLSLRNKEKPVTLTFSVSEEKPYQVKGEGIIQRRQFGFSGNGPKDEVPVSFEVTLPF
ncbi:MAG: YceI family protein [Bacteroidota bacterium]